MKCIAILVWVLGLLLPAIGMAAAPPEAAENARQLIARFLAGDTAGFEAQATPEFKEKITDAALKDISAQCVAQTGKLVEFSGIPQELPHAKLHVFRQKVRCEQADLLFTVALTVDGKIAGFNLSALPPEPEPSGKFTEEAVTVGREIPLPGTLTLPAEGTPPFPVVIFVHGSGPHDRDETVGVNRPFRDLAHQLAERGIASIRYDKRSFAHADKEFPTVYEETVQDAALAVDTAAADRRLDGDRIYVLGHSLGGMVMPRIAATTPRAAGFICMAAPARPQREFLPEQLDYLARLPFNQSEEAVAQLAAMRKLAEILDRRDYAALPKNRQTYYEDLEQFTPEAALEVERPLLFLQGGRDYQVSAERDFAVYQRLFAARQLERNDVRFILYPKLNHLMFAGEGPSTPLEYGQPHTVDPEVADGIAAFIRQPIGE